MEVEVDRHGIFKELKSTIRGSEKYLLVGVDVAKNDHHAFFGRLSGTLFVIFLLKQLAK